MRYFFPCLRRRHDWRHRGWSRCWQASPMHVPRVPVRKKRLDRSVWYRTELSPLRQDQLWNSLPYWRSRQEHHSWFLRYMEGWSRPDRHRRWDYVVCQAILNRFSSLPNHLRQTSWDYSLLPYIQERYALTVHRQDNRYDDDRQWRGMSQTIWIDIYAYFIIFLQR